MKITLMYIDISLQSLLGCFLSVGLLTSCQTGEKCESGKNCQAAEKFYTVENGGLMKEGEASRPQLVNGLSLVASFEDAERNWIKVSWRNDSESDLILVLPAKVTSDSDEFLSWPYFHLRRGDVPAYWPTALFIGQVQLQGETELLENYLSMNGMPMLANEAPHYQVDSIELHPGQSVSTIFDLGTLFERVPKQEITSAKVWFGYECKAHSGTNKEYWSGSLDSNVIELNR